MPQLRYPTILTIGTCLNSMFLKLDKKKQETRERSISIFW